MEPREKDLIYDWNREGRRYPSWRKRSSSMMKR